MERIKGGMDDGGWGGWRRRRRFPFQAFEDTRCFRVTDFLFDSSRSPEQDQADGGGGVKKEEEDRKRRRRDPRSPVRCASSCP